MHARHGFEPAKLRELHFDVLISLTARSNGAKVITSKRADFERIRKYPDLRLEVWQVARVLNFAKTETA
jgi:predicted nucleic acid-binding protein